MKRVLPVLLTGILGVMTATADPAFPTTTPSEVTLDDRLLNNLIRQVGGAKHDMHSMLLMRRGHVVVEEYYNGFDRCGPMTCVPPPRVLPRC